MYVADKDRYSKMDYAHCGKSGLKLPKVSMGFWHNFGDTGCYETMNKFASQLSITVLLIGI